MIFAVVALMTYYMNGIVVDASRRLGETNTEREYDTHPLGVEPCCFKDDKGAENASSDLHGGLNKKEKSLSGTVSI